VFLDSSLNHYSSLSSGAGRLIIFHAAKLFSKECFVDFVNFNRAPLQADLVFYAQIQMPLAVALVQE
jgi:hypothetical protein